MSKVKTATTRTGSVYFIEAVGTNLVKIGCSGSGCACQPLMLATNDIDPTTRSWSTCDG